MKHWFRNVILGLSATGLLLAGCENKKKDETTTAGADKATAQQTAGSEATAATPKPAGAEATAAKPKPAGAETRTAKLGFVKRLPADTESVFAMYRGNEMLRRLRKSKLWKFLAEQEALGGLASELENAESAESEGEATPRTVFGEEFFVATGPGAGEQLGHLLRLNNRSTHFQMRNLVKMLASQVSGEGSDPSRMGGMGAIGLLFSGNGIGDLLKDPESGLGLLEKMSVPPVLVGIRVSDKDKRESLAAQIVSGLDGAGGEVDFAESVKFERQGAKFTGMRFIGADIAKDMKENKDDITGMGIDPADADRLIKAIAKMNAVVATGVLDDYVLIFLGASEDQCKFAESPGKSIAATDGFSFMDAYAGKDIVGLIYGADKLLAPVSKESGGLKTMIGGIREGLAATKAFGDTGDIEALLQLVAEREDALKATIQCSSFGLVAFLENGFKIESLGGCVNPKAIDSTAPHALSALGEGPDVLLFVDSASNPEYGKLTRDYLEAIAETAYAVAEKASKMEEIDAPDFDQFRQRFAMFDTKLRPQAVRIWNALSGNFAEGIGPESALVIDMGGSVPPVPKVPQELVDEGKAPRISWICPVTDRSKIAASWKEIEAASRELVKVAGEMTGEEIPMPKPMSSEKNDLTTWFFTAPFFTDDFIPSVTLSNKWFVASTSKSRAVDLVGKIGGKAPQRKGAWLRLDFDVLRKFAADWVALVDKHGEKVFKDNKTMLDDFRADKKNIEDGLKASSELDDLTVHVREEGGKTRFSLHLKTR